MTAQLLLPLLPLALSLPAGDVVVFGGTPGGVGNVLVVDSSGVQPPVSVPSLSGITLLPIDVNGRTDLDALRTDRARRRSDIPGASRLLLPGGHGSLYRYSRPGAVGVMHGYFVVDGLGDARPLLEVQGIGLTLDASPFLECVSVSPSGDGLLIATRVEAGGDLLEIKLATGAVIDRTASLVPQTFADASVHLSATWGVAATAQEVLRFDRSVSGDASPISFPAPAPATFTGEIVLSRNGAFAATTAGVSPTLLHVYAFSSSGSAVQVSTAPDAVSAAGYQPNFDHGPYLAISDDGTRCAWRTEGATRELFLAEVPAGLPSPNYWLSSNANYIDTIDEIGQVMFRVGTTALVYAAGEFTPTTTLPLIENLDFFQAQLQSTGSPSIANITQTSGFPQPPFLGPANLKPATVMADPSTDALIFFNERNGGSGDVLGVDPTQPGYVVLVPNVKQVDFIEHAGAQTYVALQRKQGPDPRELYRFAAPFSTATSPLLISPGSNQFVRPAARADGWFGFVETMAAKERLWRCDPTLAVPQRLTDRQLFFGPTLAWTVLGDLAFSVGSGGTLSIFARWPTSAPVQRLPIPVQPGFVLPGA